MKLAPMSYHYVRYPIEKFLDKVERSPFDSIDLYCSASVEHVRLSGQPSFRAG